MKNITKDEAIRHHRQMWRWIAEETERLGRKVYKWEYFKVMGIDKNDIPYFECYCCEFDRQARADKTFCCQCEKCPLDWGARYEMGYKKALCSIIMHPDNKDKNKYGYFRQWLDTKSPEKAAELARIIAELPEKEE